MNKIFNASRFRKLLIKHTTEHYKGYGMALAVLIGVMALGGSFMVYMINAPMDQRVQNILFVPILLLAGTIFTSTIFADLGEKRKAIAYLTWSGSVQFMEAATSVAGSPALRLAAFHRFLGRYPI
jgi:hypothetical protein